MTEEVNMDDMSKEFFSMIYAQRGLVLSDLREFVSLNYFVELY